MTGSRIYERGLPRGKLKANRNMRSCPTRHRRLRFEQLEQRELLALLSGQLVSSWDGLSDANSLTAMGTALYYTTNEQATGRELWKFDTTKSTQTRLTDIFPGQGSA